MPLRIETDRNAIVFQNGHGNLSGRGESGRSKPVMAPRAFLGSGHSTVGTTSMYTNENPQTPTSSHPLHSRRDSDEAVKWLCVEKFRIV